MGYDLGIDMMDLEKDLACRIDILMPSTGSEIPVYSPKKCISWPKPASIQAKSVRIVGKPANYVTAQLSQGRKRNEKVKK